MIPWRRERLPTPVFWPGEFHGLNSPWGHKELDMTAWPSLSLSSGCSQTVVRAGTSGIETTEGWLSLSWYTPTCFSRRFLRASFGLPHNLAAHGPFWRCRGLQLCTSGPVNKVEAPSPFLTQPEKSGWVSRLTQSVGYKWVTSLSRFKDSSTTSQWKDCQSGHGLQKIMWDGRCSCSPLGTYICICVYVYVGVLSRISHTPLCNPMDCSLPGSSVHRIPKARILEWVAIPFPGGSSQPRDWTHISYVSCIVRPVLYHQCCLQSLYV